MTIIFKSRRLRKKAFIKIALLAVPLAFLAVQMRALGGLSKPALFAIIVISVCVLLTVIHLLLGSRRRQGRNTPTIILPGPSPDNDSASVSVSAAETGDANPETAAAFVTAPNFESRQKIIEQPTAGASQGNSRPVIALGADVAELDAPAGSVNVNVSVEPPARSDNESGADPAVSSRISIATGDTAGVSASSSIDEDINTHVDAESESRIRHPDVDADAYDGDVDMDATIVSPEELQEQVERVGDLVETHDLGSEQLVHHNGDVTIQANLSRQDDSSDASTSLITAISHADTANLAELSHSEVTQLVVKLKKDKVRLHRLVIAQQSAIYSERKAHDRSRTVARDAIKIMRNSREAQKLAEKVARKERSERKRIEQEYIKVAKALINARSIIKARNDETA